MSEMIFTWMVFVAALVMVELMAVGFCLKVVCLLVLAYRVVAVPEVDVTK